MASASKAQARMQEALAFLAARADSMAAVAPPGKAEEYRANTWWWPTEPAYSWRRTYGDFDPATMRAGVRQGLIRTPPKHTLGFQITEAGVAALTAAGDLLARIGALDAEATDTSDRQPQIPGIPIEHPSKGEC